VPGLGVPNGMFVMADGNRLVSTSKHTLQLLTPAGQLALIAGDEDEDAGFEDGKGANARFNFPNGMTVDAAGHIVVVDMWNHALRRVSKAGEVSTLAGNGEAGFADGQGEAARFNFPVGMVLAANDEIVVADTENNAIRVVTPGGAVRTLAGNGEAGFADGQGAAARFNRPTALARDKDGSILVADRGNNAVRRVTMEGAVSTVAGNGEAGYADGEGAAARFNCPTAVVVDKEGTILVADRNNHMLRKIVGRQVTTLHGRRRGGRRALQQASCAGAGRARAPASVGGRPGGHAAGGGGLAGAAGVDGPGGRGGGGGGGGARGESSANRAAAGGLRQAGGGRRAGGRGVCGGGGALSAAPQRAGGAERVLSGSLQVGDAGRGLQGGVLRGRECLSVPGAAAVPLRGRSGRGNRTRRAYGRDTAGTVGWCPQLASLPDGLRTVLSSVLRDLRVTSMFLKELPAWLAELAELESLKICGYVALRRQSDCLFATPSRATHMNTM